MRCPECGAAADARWDACRACGSRLPRPKTPTLDARVTQAGAAVMPALRRARGSVRTPAVRLPALNSGFTASAPRLGRVWNFAPRNAWQMAAVGLALLSLVLLALLMRERMAASDARAEASTLSSQLTTAQTSAQGASGDAEALRKQALDAAAAGQAATKERDAARADLAAAQRSVQQAQADLEAARTTIAERDTTIGTQRTALSALSDCLGGTSVAIEFGRRGNWSAADRSLAAVASQCSVAQSPTAPSTPRRDD